MGLSAFSWLGRNNDVAVASPYEGRASSPAAVAPPEPAPPPEDDFDRWVDVPREEWGDYPLLELLPEHRQRYWQQQRTDKYGSVSRYFNTSTKVIEAEVFAHTMGRLIAVLDKLERKL